MFNLYLGINLYIYFFPPESGKSKYINSATAKMSLRLLQIEEKNKNEIDVPPPPVWC